jgi:hypothetical protein
MNAKRMPRALLATAACCLGLAQTASADGFYFGLTGGASSFDVPYTRAEVDQTVVDLFALGGADVLEMESSLDDSDSGWGVAVGYRWGRFIAAELGYTNFGEALYQADLAVEFPDGTIGIGENSVRTRIQGPAVSVLGMLPIGSAFDLHLRGGILFADTRERVRLGLEAFELDGRSRDLFAGLGATWNFAENYAGRLEYQRYFDVGDDDHTDEQDVDFIALSILFR